MALTLDKMKLKVCGLTMWACFANKSEEEEIWAAGGAQESSQCQGS